MCTNTHRESNNHNRTSGRTQTAMKEMEFSYLRLEFQATVKDDTKDAAAKTIETVQENVTKTVGSVQTGVSTTIKKINKSVDGEDFEDTFMKLGQKLDKDLR